jgi:lipopolysaccharide transport system ATP-binding protein
MPAVIAVEHLSKQYRLGAIGGQTLHDDLDRWWARLRGRPDPLLRIGQADSTRPSDKLVWALRDVSFEVQQGEVLGIIGRNGAGKSTLLKILSRITAPTSGQVKVKGRIASLLEVGTGFHPELTGRENIYLNGAILGMRRLEIDRKLDEIVDFSGVEQFIDTPVKRYSSGMYVRLAFAVAAHLEPEILLVDEVLAVGDTSFQKKCLGKMDQIAAAGRTIIFVSHNLEAIRSLTTRLIYLNLGTVLGEGETEVVVRQYLSHTIAPLTAAKPDIAAYHRGAASDSPVRIVRMWANNCIQESAAIGFGDDFSISVEVESTIEIRGALLVLSLRREDGTSILVSSSADIGYRLNAMPGMNIVKCTVSGLPLPPGGYLGGIGINQGLLTNAWDVIVDYPILRVEDNLRVVAHWSDRPWGAVHWTGVSWQLIDQTRSNFDVPD